MLWLLCCLTTGGSAAGRMRRWIVVRRSPAGPLQPLVGPLRAHEASLFSVEITVEDSSSCDHDCGR